MLALFRRLTALIVLMFFLLASQPATAGVDRWTSTGPGGGSIWVLLGDPSSPSTLYALAGGTLVYSGNSIYKSVNGGVSWKWSGVGTPSITSESGSQSPQGLALDPSRPWVLYTSICLGPVGRVFRSIDGAAHWTEVASRVGDEKGFGVNPTTCSLAVAPGRPSTVYFANGSALQRSTDGGETWISAFRAPVEIKALLVDPRSPSTLYVGTGPGGGLWRSLDRGLSFHPVAGLDAVEALAASGSERRLYAAGGDEILTSTDGGASWKRRGAIGRLVNALAVDAGSSSILYAGHEKGFSVSQDGGATWAPANRGLSSVSTPRVPGPVPVFSLAVHPVKPGALWAGTEFTGVYRSANRGRQWTAGDQPGLDNTLFRPFAVSPISPDTLYTVSFDNVQALWKSSDGGRSWTLLSDQRSRGIALYSLVADPFTPALYATGNSLYRSNDGGVTWNDLGLPNTSVLAVLAPGLLLAATQTGLFRSTDDGASWTQVSTLSGNLIADPERPGTVYLGYFEHLPEGDTGVVDRSLDGGLTWQRLVAGSPDIVVAPGGILYLPVAQELRRSTDGGVTWETVGPFPTDRYWLVVDPQDAEKLYLSSSFSGLWRSADHGVTWQPANAGLAWRGSLLYIILVPHPTAAHTFFALPMNGGIFTARFTGTD
jgi:photosystem II stability/assembly factor-like uncharacterized protein